MRINSETDKQKKAHEIRIVTEPVWHGDGSCWRRSSGGGWGSGSGRGNGNGSGRGFGVGRGWGAGSGNG